MLIKFRFDEGMCQFGFEMYVFNVCLFVKAR